MTLQSILKAKRARFGLRSLGRALVNEEEGKAKKKGSSCIRLFVELELAFVLEGRCFYYTVITGYILRESTLLALLQANHVWGTEVHQMQPNGRVGQKLNLSQSPGARFQQSPGARFQQARSQIKGEKNPQRAIQHRDTNCASRSLQAPACRNGVAGTYCCGLVLFLQLFRGHWATELNRKQVTETDGPWSGFIWLRLFLCPRFLKVCSRKKYTHNMPFQRVNTWIRRNQ